MRTSIQEVKMAMLIDGKSVEQKFPISDDGVLMKQRLTRLLMNQVGVQREDDHRVIHVIGPIWQAPYTLLGELIDERVRLQALLEAIGGGEAKLLRIPRREVPLKTSSGQITTLMQKELRLIKHLKEKIALMEELTALTESMEERVRAELTAEFEEKIAAKNTEQSVEPSLGMMAPPYAYSGGWDIH